MFSEPKKACYTGKNIMHTHALRKKFLVDDIAEKNAYVKSPTNPPPPLPPKESHTVKPLLNGHPWELPKSPLNRGHPTLICLKCM